MWNINVWYVVHEKAFLVISSPIEVCVTSRGGLTAHAIRTQPEGALKQIGYEHIWPWDSFRSLTFLKELFLFRPRIGTHSEILQFNFIEIRTRALKAMPFHLCNTEIEKLILNAYTKVPFTTLKHFSCCKFRSITFTEVVFTQHSFLARDSKAVHSTLSKKNIL